MALALSRLRRIQAASLRCPSARLGRPLSTKARRRDPTIVEPTDAIIERVVVHPVRDADRHRRPRWSGHEPWARACPRLGARAETVMHAGARIRNGHGARGTLTWGNAGGRYWDRT